MIEFFYYLLVLFSYPFKGFMSYEIPSLKKELWFKYRFLIVFFAIFFIEVFCHKIPYFSFLYLVVSFFGYSREVSVLLIGLITRLDIIAVLLLNNIVESSLRFSWRRYFLEYVVYIVILLIKGYFHVSTL